MTAEELVGLKEELNRVLKDSIGDKERESFYELLEVFYWIDNHEGLGDEDAIGIWSTYEFFRSRNCSIDSSKYMVELFYNIMTKEP